MKHFEALGIEVEYKAPVKEFAYFKNEADKVITKQMQEV
jgi:type III restriction enzyme